MTEINVLYDLRPGTDLQAYQEWAKKVIAIILRAPGIIEFRANRNVLGEPNIRTVTVWKSLSDWGNFAESTQWQEIVTELSTRFAQNIQVGIWGPSPVIPDPLRP